MKQIKLFYIHFYVLVYALYTFFDKGIAYSYLAELLLVVGLLIMLKDFRKLEIIWDKPVKLLLVLIGITFLFILRGIGKYPLMDIVRDSFMFNYAIFVFILFVLKDEIDYLIEQLISIYKWYPLVACCSFLAISYLPFFETFIVFGKVPLLIYKYGDMGVQLLISSLLMLNGYVKISKRFAILNSIITIYLFLVLAAYSRAGMLVYIMGIVLFFVFTKNKELKQIMMQYLKFAPVLGFVAISLYVATKVQNNFQGRKVGLDQLKENSLSIISDKTDGTLSNNKAWRLLWWGKIIDDTFTGSNFLFGRGLGMSMSEVDEIVTEEENVRSPHNFHLNVLGRFGLPFFILWIFWVWLVLIKMKNKVLSQFNFTLLVILFAFIANASFDVYLEGPMGAFPFWTFVGIFFISEYRSFSKEKSEIAAGGLITSTGGQ